MATALGFNPMKVTNSPGSFPLESDGLILGTAYADPSSRNWLCGGPLSANEVLPMYGGVAITEGIQGFPPPAGSPAAKLGGVVSRATAPANFTGLSVFDQAHHAILVPGAPLPLVFNNMSVHFYRWGSFARVAVAIDASLINQGGNLITTQFSWDYVNSRVVPFVAAYNGVTVTGVAYNAGTQMATYTTSAAHGLGAGVDVNFSGFTPAGYNGAFTTQAGTAGTSIVVPMATNPGAVTVPGSLLAGGGAMPGRIIEVRQSNCMGPQLNADGTYGWNYNAAGAVVLM